MASLDELGRTDGSVAGILAWYSTIHLEHTTVPAVLQEFRRCLRAYGTVVVGFFTSERLEPFPHAVTAAYSWPVGKLAQHLEDAGFSVQDVHVHPNPDRPERSHAAILAERTRSRAGRQLTDVDG